MSNIFKEQGLPNNECENRGATGSIAISAARERILNTAARLFRARGYHRTTVREIADALGLFSGSLFHHFRSKEDLLLEIMRYAANSLCIQTEEVVSRLSAPAEKLRALIHLELEHLVGGSVKDYYAVLISEWRYVPEHAKSEFTILRRRYAHSWRGVLNNCKAIGRLRCEPSVANNVLHGATTGAMMWFRPSGRYSLEEYGNFLADLILDDVLLDRKT